MAYRIQDNPSVRLSIRLVRDETPDGRLISLKAETLRNGKPSSVQASIVGSTLLLEGRRGKDQVMRQLPHNPALRLSDGEWLSGERISGEITEMEPGVVALLSGRIERSTARSPGAEEAELHYRDGLLADAWILQRDAEGRVVRAEKPLPGGSQIYIRGEGPVRAGELSANRGIGSMRFKSPFAISEGALKGHIRYQFGLRAGAPITLPETPEQRVRRLDDGALRVDICKSCGPGLPDDAESLTRWRQPSAWIESDAPELVEAAKTTATRRISERSKMKALGEVARKRLATVEFFGHHSARQAWKRRGGDCTEDANVYAALARAAGIPARVANGLVFMRERYFGAENAFQPHSWVIAYTDGKWESYDISIGAFDATHIALAMGDGEPAPILAANRKAGLLEWQAMAEVRSR
jgi:hypothetical protein